MTNYLMTNNRIVLRKAADFETLTSRLKTGLFLFLLTFILAIKPLLFLHC